MVYAGLPASSGAASWGAGASPIRVLIVDDHFALADSLALAIDLEDDMECVGMAGTVSEALELVVGSDPHVVLMDAVSYTHLTLPTKA